MLVNRNIKGEWIQTIPKFFENNIALRNLDLYFDIHLSKNITHDILSLDSSFKIQNESELAGINILPSKDHQKIQVIISEQECGIDVILHELTHMFDMVLFSEQFCNGKLYEIKNHKYYQTFIYWSEFHVKQIDIPYTQLLLEIYSNIPKESWLVNFKKQIKTFFYPEYNKKFANKLNPRMRDVMWYFGEIVVCNLYDENNTYIIPQEILVKYESKFLELYTAFINCISFNDFVANVSELHRLFSQ